jgi:hypothetical protein
MNAANAAESRRHCKNFRTNLSKSAVIVLGAFTNLFPTAVSILRDLAGM